MTAFPKLVEMPIGEREESAAPADPTERLLRIHPQTAADRWCLNHAAHTAPGAGCGAAYGVAAHRGLHGAPGAAETFAVIHTQDLVSISLLGLGKPWAWSCEDWTTDVLDEVVVIAATGRMFDRVLSANTPGPRVGRA